MCPVCGSRRYTEDEPGGDVICEGCGRVFPPLAENPSYAPGNPDWERDFELTREP